jgi:tRNA G37 N-methylase Trm5
MRAAACALFVGTLLAVGHLSAAGQQPAPAAPTTQQPLDVIYVPTAHEVVSEMLAAVKVGPGDVVFDLGSGDGRIPIAAVRDFGAARAVGIELDPVRIREARANAVAAGVSDRVRFVRQDLFAADLSEATVIALYLLPHLNARLEPRLHTLERGTRIVSHNYDMGPAWQPDRSFVVMNNLIHVWTVRR